MSSDKNEVFRKKGAGTGTITKTGDARAGHGGDGAGAGDDAPAFQVAEDDDGVSLGATNLSLLS